MPRYKLTIAYDGTDFCGWQRQEPRESDAGNVPPQRIAGSFERDGEKRLQLRTVQHAVEQAVMQIVREHVTIKGSSRTDAGVHSKGQVAAFTCSGDEDGASADRSKGWPVSRGTDRLLRALNGRLPDDVLITGVEAVPAEFDPIRDTRSKGYSYTFHASRERALWDRRFVHQVWEPLDVAAMRAAAALLVGEHDFAAFAASGHGRLTTVRTIFACEVSTPAPDRVRIDVSGNGFLWNMVRIIAGTLADVGRGRIAPTDIPGIIAGAKREEAGPTMPPTGLCLEWIEFGRPGAGKFDEDGE